MYILFLPQRAKERDARKAKAKEKKLHGEKEALLAAIKVSILMKINLISVKHQTCAIKVYTVHYKLQVRCKLT